MWNVDTRLSIGLKDIYAGLVFIGLIDYPNKKFCFLNMQIARPKNFLKIILKPYRTAYFNGIL